MMITLMLVSALFSGPAPAACENIVGLSPAQGTVVSESRPTLSWNAVPGANSYRVRIRAQVPEGRTLATFDTQTQSPSFTPPAPLAEQTAKVSVNIVAQCGEGKDANLSSTYSGHFLIDTRLSCPAPAGVNVERSGPEVRLNWQPVPSAVSYELAAFAALDGKELTRMEAQTNSATLPLGNEEVVTLMLRARCQAGYGEPHLKVLPPR